MREIQFCSSFNLFHMLFFFSNLNPIINERLVEYSIFSLQAENWYFAVNLKGFSLVKRTWGSLFNLFVLFCFVFLGGGWRWRGGFSQYQGLFQAPQFTISFAFYGYLFWLVILKAPPLVAHEGCKGFAIWNPLDWWKTHFHSKKQQKHPSFKCFSCE